MRLGARVAQRLAVGSMGIALLATTLVSAAQTVDEELDPARNKPLPCENPGLGLPPLPARSEYKTVHLANRCGIVGTDVELQSRRDGNGNIHDYALLGTMGYGFRIFDVTDPSDPVGVGGYNDAGWENDIQVRGNVVVSTFDGVVGEPSTGSTCLKTKYPDSSDQGVDIFKLNFNATKAVTKAATTFDVSNVDCIANPPGGAHNATLHPGGKWLAISNPSSDWAIDIIDLRRLSTTGPVHRFRLIDESRRNTSGITGPRCPDNATFKCIVMKRPPSPNLGSDTSNPPCNPSCTGPKSAYGLWRPHDIFFSRDGNTMYVAALNSTFITNVTNVNKVFSGALSTISDVPTISIIPNVTHPAPQGSTDPLDNPRNIELSHQADTTPDGKILVINDERGGGLSETRCNTDSSGVIGAVHFWALRDIGVAASTGATPQRPKELGAYFNPNPGLGLDPLQVQIAALPRAERGCSSHVFRIGGNGTASPGPIQPGFDGVSRLSNRVLVEAWYGAGVWRINFTRPTIRGDGIPEEPRSTWGNTLGWNVQAGADTWSAKEYKGYIYAGDILRGFDVYACTSGDACPKDPIVTLTMAGPATATRGSTVTYSISYKNQGPKASSNARIVDQLPPELSFVSASDGASFDPGSGEVTWQLGTVNVGSSGTVTVTAQVKPTTSVGSSILNRADFSGDLTVSNPAFVTTSITG